MPQVDEFGRAVPESEAPSYASYSTNSATTTTSHGIITSTPVTATTTTDVYEHDPLPSRGPRHGGPPIHHHHQHHQHHHHHDSHHNNNSHYNGSYGGSPEHPHPRHHHHHSNNNYHPYEHPRGGGSNHTNHYHHRGSNNNNNNNHPHSRNSRRGHKDASSSSAAALPHPSERYVAEPMLCEFLWKEQQQQQTEQPTEQPTPAKENAETSASVTNDNNDADTNNNNNPEASSDTKTEEPSNTESTIQKEEQDQQEQETPSADPSNNNYDKYRTTYGWNFCKHFFNQHLDDSWFRQAYSPALQVQQVKWERTRALHEAKLLRQELVKANTTTNNNNSLHTLVSLTKPNTVLGAGHDTPIPSAHVPSSNAATLHFPHVPSHVTDEQITAAAIVPMLTNYYMKKSSASSTSSKKSSLSPHQVLEQGLLGLCSSTPLNHHGNNNNMHHHHNNSPPKKSMRGGASSTTTTSSSYLHRSVFAVFTSPDVCEGVWQGLVVQQQQQQRANNSTTNNPHGNSDGHVPRKHHGTMNGILEIDVDCTDPYGRTEYDANGRGGAPPDGLAIPPRKATIAVEKYNGGTTMDNTNTTTFHTLSAALSSPLRFATDLPAAATIARALDERQHIPDEDRLAALWEQLGFVSNEEETSTDNDNDQQGEQIRRSSLKLDIAVAYLRRVHLYSFYKATRASCWGDFLAGKSPAGQIHLRDIIDLPPEEEADLVKDDLLGQRLNDQIQDVLDTQVPAWTAQAAFVVDEATDAAAQEIEQAQEAATQQWLANHSMDDDGRARCSFHFCHKLFKDDTFLKKHLLKKHSAYNAAERAKCHDTHMMTQWEKAALRPMVPPILVDCGKQFGKVESLLSGGPDPKAVDPEPALWERKQQADKLRMERSELRAARSQTTNYDNSARKASGDGMTSPRPSNRTFVDVDDMKDETVVEVSFDQVQLPVVTSKKKKKKRKLL